MSESQEIYGVMRLRSDALQMQRQAESAFRRGDHVGADALLRLASIYDESSKIDTRMTSHQHRFNPRRLR